MSNHLTMMKKKTEKICYSNEGALDKKV